jgi:hypothetical protein
MKKLLCLLSIRKKNIGIIKTNQGGMIGINNNLEKMINSFNELKKANNN